MRRNVIWISLSSVLFLGACPIELAQTGAVQKKEATPASKQGEAIAEIGNLRITRNEIQREFDTMSPFVRSRYQTEAQRREFIETKVRMELLALDAIDKGMDKDRDVQDALKKLLAQKVTRKEFDNLVDPKDIAPEEVQLYYTEHHDEFSQPEMFRLSHIFIAFGTDKADAKKRIDELYALAIKSGKDPDFLRDLVAKHSEDPDTKLIGGDLRYLAPAEIEERYGKAAKDMITESQVFDKLLEVVEGIDGYHVFLRRGYRKPIERRLEQVSGQIKNTLFKEKRAAAFTSFVEGLKEKYGFTFNQEVFSKLKIAQGSKAPPPHQHGKNPLDALKGVK